MPQPQGPLRSRTYEDGSTVEVKPPRRRSPSQQEGPNYVMVDIYALTKAPEIFTKTEQRILAEILTHYRVNEPYCLLNKAEIARRVGISRQNLQRAMDVLIADGWVSRISPTCWAVSPYYGWRGSRTAWAAARRIAEQPNWRGAEIDPEIIDPVLDEVDYETGEIR